MFRDKNKCGSKEIAFMIAGNSYNFRSVNIFFLSVLRR
jgi:hypothetical protein